MLNAYREPYQPLFQQRFFAYFFVGIGVFYGRPKGDLFRGDIAAGERLPLLGRWQHPRSARGFTQCGFGEHRGARRHSMRRTSTAGTPKAVGSRTNGRDTQPTDALAHRFPLGFRHPLHDHQAVELGAEFAYYSFITDKLDDVSDRYATYDEIDATFAGDSTNQWLARYISDPTGWGTVGYEDERTSPRGNPGLPDYFSYLSMEVSWKLDKTAGARRLTVRSARIDLSGHF